MTTIVEAILQVMQAEGKPLTAREIHDLIMQTALYHFKAKDSVHVVASQIRRHCLGKDFQSSSNSKYFEPVGKNRYYFLAAPVYQSKTLAQKETEPIQISKAQQPALKEKIGIEEKIQKAGSARTTIILAIKEVMQDHGKPMTIEQIYDAIVSRNLYSFKASQPMHVVKSQIRRHCLGLDFPSASDVKHFEMRGRGRYYFLHKPIRQKLILSQVGTNTNVEETAEKQITQASKSRDKHVREHVFISYSHKDLRWLQRLLVHLKPLEKLGIITRWDDTRIRPGANWRKEIEGAIKRARVAVLLISADFLASDFIIDNELPPLLQAAASDDAMILPVIVSPCRFEKTNGLRQFQAINLPSRPLSALDKNKREEIFVKVADAIEGALYTL